MTHRITKTIAALAITAIMAVPALAAEKGASTSNVGSDLWYDAKTGNVEFVNGGDVAGLQFDIAVGDIPESGYRCGGTLPDQFIANCFMNDGVLRVVIYSTNNAMIPDSTVLSVKSRSSGSSDLRVSEKRGADRSVSNVIFSDDQGKNTTPGHL